LPPARPRLRDRLRRFRPGAARRQHATEVSSRRAFADFAVQIGGQLVNLTLGIVTTIVIVRALGETRYGEWATLTAGIELVILVGSLGLETVAIRFAAQDPEREGNWVGAATSLQLLLAIPVCAVFIVLVTLIASGSQMLVAGLVLSVLFFTSAISTLRIVFRLHVRNHVTVAFLTANSVIWTGSVVAIAASDGGLVAYAVAFAATSVLIQGSLALLALKTIAVHWRGAREFWPRLARVGISVGIAAALTFAYGRLDQILVYELAPNSDEVGVYAAMYKILDNAGFVPMAMLTTLFPIMAGLYPADLARLHRIVQNAIDYLSIVALGAVALTVVAAAPIVELLFGAEYASGATTLAILFVAFIPISIGYVAGNMVIATNLQRRYILYALAGLLVNIPLNVVLIPEYGIEAAAWVTVATEVVVVAATLVTVLRKLEMRLSLRRILLTTLAAGVAGLAVWGLREAGAGAILLVISMAIVYPALLVALRALDPREVRELIRKRDVDA
jgi:O-antigen/teichoic acid export membrane protein